MRSALLVLALVAVVGTAFAQDSVDEGFEGVLPDFHTYQATYAADSTRAHGGTQSLRVTPTGETGGAYFRLDGKIDWSSDYEFTAWVRAGADGAVSFYLSAADGKQRYTISRTGGGVAGQWVQLRGVVRAKQWRATDRDVMLAMTTRGESWFDDVVLRKTALPDPAIEVWPKLEAALHAAADPRASTVRRGQRLQLDATQAAFAPDLTRQDVSLPAAPAIAIPAEGLLTFAIDTEEALVLTGTAWLEPDAELRPGLRAYVLSDATVVAAPMLRAASWRNVGNAETGPAPAVRGEPPAVQVPLVEWRLPKGRHYLTVAGPHTRPAGLFRQLELQGLERPAPEPLYEFALLADTHLGSGRSEWMNVKMNGPAIQQLTQTLTNLRTQGVALALIAGDMTDGATRDHFGALGRGVRDAGLPVYGCIGNHDSYHATSRADVMELAPGLFPTRRTDYAFTKPPLRFIVLDGSWWRDRDGQFLDHYDRSKATGITIKPEQLEWLRTTLAADAVTPTLVTWHYPFYNRRGESSCGYQLGKATLAQPVMDILAATPNVVATLNGHTHWNAVDLHAGIVCIQNPAYAEWPNAYRVFRVYPDHLEWEVRQVGNRGFVSEGVLAARALTWMLSTGDGDLAGSVGLALRKRD